MRPRELIGEGFTPDGRTVTLHREAEGFVVRVGNEVLMSSRSHGSEVEMAARSLAVPAKAPRPRVLIGGLGMGYTLRAALDVLPRHAEVVVAEFLECVVEWNRGPIGPLAGSPLQDRRVQLEIRDVRAILQSPGDGFDAILLDVDNGPEAFTTPGNALLYGPHGLAALKAALRPRGVLAVWSAFPSRPFEKALTKALFYWEAVTVRSRQDSAKGPRHTLFLARPRLAAEATPSGAPAGHRP